MNSIILTITTLFAGLIAGLFYAWSISVTPGIGKTDNISYLKAFQAMNRAILNPAFFIVFFGLVILLIYLSFASYNNMAPNQYRLIVTATAFYLGGIMLVTVAGNVPLNNSLEALQIESMNPEQMSAFREGFESKWNRLNMIRTFSSSISFLLLIIACMNNNN